MFDKMLQFIIKRLVNFQYERTGFMAWSWGIDKHTHIHIISEESYLNRHRFGTREEKVE